MEKQTNEQINRPTNGKTETHKSMMTETFPVKAEE